MTQVLRKQMRLRHYGSSQFDPEKFVPVCDDHWVKPKGGLWGSPVDSQRGWKHWCEAEDFGDTSEWFDFDIEGEVFVVDSVADMRELPWIESLRAISFEALIACGVDAVHLTDAGEIATRFTRPYSLYGWDCESVLVLNPAIICAEVPT